ncbi:MAG: phosphoesterase [Synechococcus sp. SB0668_bin_15]|nr:phosphoesterase [Synechococcus sp. SB0668_bin_15]MXZ83906.1 phosphoesterase [Synechococcus sp. SB0666_bin_14]MYC49157.1 phosphoesterase [Synechococcus sp. SB0662_bin_14]MYG45781.1 phosphoesterase [Synechococcus sp. SB0675_bin_6]MYJ60553.1 phosphoesterase [Synechococcus sp. SB0672_bin_6]MYK91510.1 phosphoesterase [Synechococcus sp. SB0669_bin_8]
MVSWLLRALDILLAFLLGFLVLSRTRGRGARTQGLIKGYLLLVVVGWLVQQQQAPLPLTDRLIQAMVLICGLALAFLLQSDLRRLLDLLGSGRWGQLLGRGPQSFYNQDAVSMIGEAAGRMSQNRRGALILVDLGSDLQDDDFLTPGIPMDAVLSIELLLNVFSVHSPLHDGAVLVRGERIVSAGVILPLARQKAIRFGTRHLAAVGITERFDQCLCVVVSEETGTISLAQRGHLERPITSNRLKELLGTAMENVAWDPVESTAARRPRKAS